VQPRLRILTNKTTWFVETYDVLEEDWVIPSESERASGTIIIPFSVLMTITVPNGFPSEMYSECGPSSF